MDLTDNNLKRPMLMIRLFNITVVLLVITQNTFAAERFSNFYLFTSLGKSDLSDMATKSDINQAESNLIATLNNQFSLQNPDATLPGYSVELNADKTGPSASIGIGYFFHELLSVEASYQYLGRIKVSGPISDSENNQLNYSKTGVIAGFDLRTFFHTPSFKGFNGFAHWGATLWSRETRTKFSFANEENTETSKDKGFEVVFGAGLQYLTKNDFGFSIAWEQYNIKQENVDIVKASLLYFPI